MTLLLAVGVLCLGDLGGCKNNCGDHCPGPRGCKIPAHPCMAEAAQWVHDTFELVRTDPKYAALRGRILNQDGLTTVRELSEAMDEYVRENGGIQKEIDDTRDLSARITQKIRVKGALQELEVTAELEKDAMGKAARGNRKGAADTAGLPYDRGIWAREGKDSAGKRTFSPERGSDASVVDVSDIPRKQIKDMDQYVRDLNKAEHERARENVRKSSEEHQGIQKRLENPVTTQKKVEEVKQQAPPEQNPGAFEQVNRLIIKMSVEGAKKVEETVKKRGHALELLDNLMNGTSSGEEGKP